MITKAELQEVYNISDEYFEDADISWEDLTEIYNHFCTKYEDYEKILHDFEKDYLTDLQKAGIHSYHTRVKDAEHLVVKIIRKRKENYRKYKKLTKNNYEKFVTDLIGIRGLILFKEQWENFHKYILERFENDPQNYIKDSLKDFDDNPEHCYIAEPPKAHIRNGDSREIYGLYLKPNNIQSDKIYRAVHYIIKYKGVYLEIQIRTLFEEGWGEVNHAIVYPYYQEDPVFKEYTELLNRVAGLADEMGSFFGKIKELETEYLQYKKSSEIENIEQLEKGKEEKKQEIYSTGNTPLDCLNEVLHE